MDRERGFAVFIMVRESILPRLVLLWREELGEGRRGRRKAKERWGEIERRGKKCRGCEVVVKSDG